MEHPDDSFEQLSFWQLLFVAPEAMRPSLRRLVSGVDNGYSSRKLKQILDARVGTMLVSNSTIPRSETVFKIDLKVADGRLVDHPTTHSVQVSEKQHLDLMKVQEEKGGQARYLSHLQEPNLRAAVGDALVFSALRDISPGEELGFHYCTTEWAMTSPFACARDGAQIQGYAYLDDAARQKLQQDGLLAAHVQRLARKS
mmetsp:Transcript_72941/g.170908  ORF Transcript_72941/g.170908 Transcript_72941/m.170908 type:complete len:199 (-) Transcript_72941:29-625(-)